MKALPLLLLAMSLPMFAQTTYSSTTPFVCDAASYHPIQYSWQFSCRGVRAAVGAEYFWFSNNGFEASAPVLPPTQEGHGVGVTQFTVPANGNPGTLVFNWTVTDYNNVAHTGSVSWTWVDQVICGGRGCLWHAPKLLTNSITIDN